MNTGVGEGRLKLVFGGMLLPGARIFAGEEGRSFSLLCATACGGFVWHVKFSLVGLGSFFDHATVFENVDLIDIDNT